MLLQSAWQNQTNASTRNTPVFAYSQEQFALQSMFAVSVFLKTIKINKNVLPKLKVSLTV